MFAFPGIRLKFEGKAYVHWTEEHSTGTGDDQKTEIRHYRASEKYFEQEVLLFGICKQHWLHLILQILKFKSRNIDCVTTPKICTCTYYMKLKTLFETGLKITIVNQSPVKYFLFYLYLPLHN